MFTALNLISYFDKYLHIKLEKYKNQNFKKKYYKKLMGY